MTYLPRMAQQIAALVVLTAVNFIYIHSTTVPSITDDFSLIHQFYAICDTQCLFEIPPQHEHV
jgi:hypothetical protein